MGTILEIKVFTFLQYSLSYQLTPCRLIHSLSDNLNSNSNVLSKNININRKNTIDIARSPNRNPEVGLVKQETLYIRQHNNM